MGFCEWGKLANYYHCCIKRGILADSSIVEEWPTWLALNDALLVLHKNTRNCVSIAGVWTYLFIILQTNRTLPTQTKIMCIFIELLQTLLFSMFKDSKTVNHLVMLNRVYLVYCFDIVYSICNMPKKYFSSNIHIKCASLPNHQRCRVFM